MHETLGQDHSTSKSVEPLRVGYLVNQYPKISHTFIRTEISALEELGCQVARFSIRPTPDQLVDSEDIAEEERTRVVLGIGVSRFFWKAFKFIVLRPARTFSALLLAARLGFRSDRGVFRHVIYVAEAAVVCDWAEAERIRHIHAHFGTNSAAVAVLCRVLGGPPFSFTVHGPEEFDKRDLISLPLKIQRATFVAAVSNFGRAQLWRITDVNEWDKIQVIRCGADKRFLEAEPSNVPETNRLISIGRLSEQKGQLILLRAAARLSRAMIDFRIDLVGDGELRGILEKVIDDLHLRDSVRITGWLSPEEIRELILDSRALVLPSFAEGLPVVIMESLALQRPVISTYIAGIPELVVPEKTGWLVPAGAVEPLADAMRVVLETPVEQLSTMGRVGRQQVLEQHDPHKNARLLRTLIDESAQHGRD